MAPWCLLVLIQVGSATIKKKKALAKGLYNKKQPNPI